MLFPLPAFPKCLLQEKFPDSQPQVPLCSRHLVLTCVLHLTPVFSPVGGGLPGGKALLFLSQSPPSRTSPWQTVGVSYE